MLPTEFMDEIRRVHEMQTQNQRLLQKNADVLARLQEKPPIPPGWTWDETLQEYRFPDGFGDTVFLGFLGNCVQIGCRVGPDSEGDREEGDEDTAVITRREDALQIAFRLRRWAETGEVPS